MKHVRADLGRRRQAHVLDEHLLAVHDLPVAGQHQIVADSIHERHDGLPLRQRRDGTALEAVAAVDDQRVLRILLSQRVDHRAQRGEPAPAFEGGCALLVEELVVDLELRVNVGGVQNGEVRRVPRLHRLAWGEVGTFSPALEAGRQDRAQPEAQPHRTDMRQERASTARGRGSHSCLLEVCIVAATQSPRAVARSLVARPGCRAAAARWDPYE